MFFELKFSLVDCGVKWFVYTSHDKVKGVIIQSGSSQTRRCALNGVGLFLILHLDTTVQCA